MMLYSCTHMATVGVKDMYVQCAFINDGMCLVTVIFSHCTCSKKLFIFVVMWFTGGNGIVRLKRQTSFDCCFSSLVSTVACCREGA